MCVGAAFGEDTTLTAIQGTVSNEKGEPVSDARVDVSTAAPVSGPAIFCPSCYLDCRKWTTTDKAGCFRIADLDPRLKFRLVASATGYKTAQSKLIAPGEENHDLTLQERPKTIDPQCVVSGSVNNEHGIPIQGAVVIPVATINEEGLRSFSSNGVASAVTDADGNFEIDLVGGVYGIDVEIAANGWCSRRFIGLNPNANARAFEILEGAHFTGHVESRGRPVVGMTIAVATTDRSSSGEKFFQKAIPAVTDAQGNFEFRNLLPSREYCVYTVVGEADRSDSVAVIRTQKFVTPPSGKTLNIGGLTTVDPVALSGRVASTDRRPLQDLYLSIGRHPAWDLIKVPVANDGSFRIEGLPPEVYEIEIASRQFDLDAGKIDTLLWTEKSIKRFIDESINDFVLPIRFIERGGRDTEQDGTQLLAGRLTLTGGEGASGIVVSANDGNAPETVTADDGHFTLEFPVTTDWIKLYRPDPDGMRFWYLGRFEPKPGDNDICIQLGPETTYEPDTLSVPHQ